MNKKSYRAKKADVDWDAEEAAGIRARQQKERIRLEIVKKMLNRIDVDAKFKRLVVDAYIRGLTESERNSWVNWNP